MGWTSRSVQRLGADWRHRRGSRRLERLRSENVVMGKLYSLEPRPARGANYLMSGFAALAEGEPRTCRHVEW